MKKQIVNISGPWEFREFPETARRMSDLNEGRWLAAAQPQSIFLGLAEAGILMLSDLYAQPQAFGWVSRQAWVYRTRFSLPQEHLAADRAELVFEGLDTVTQIWLNEKLLGRTENMFIAHCFDVGSLLRPGQNDLVIQFQPVEEYADKLMQRYGKIGGHSDIPPSAYLRKAQYQFGSAMGPALPGCGIIGPVRLELIHTADIGDIHLRTIDCNESFADIRAAVTIRPTEQAHDKNLRCVLRIEGNGVKLSHTLDFGNRQARLSTVLRIEHPILWQPRGYGQPYRYAVTAQLYCGEELLDIKEISFGVRTVRALRQQETETITLEVNQQPIETKSVYWIPVGLLPGPDDSEKKRQLLHKLAEANINLLCIWGGGCYEDDAFYDLCDQLGILVWQELMFAPPYPADSSWFTGQFRQEMEQIVRRLRNHTCLVGWYDGQLDWRRTELLGKKKKEVNSENFHKTVTELLNEWDPDRDCVPAPPMSESQKCRHSPANVNDWRNARNAPVTTGDGVFPALPCLKTLRMTCRDEEIFPGSVQVENQNYHTEGLSHPACQTSRLFTPPKTVEEQIYQDQVAQGRMMKKNIESLRSGCGSHRQIMPWTAGQFWPGAGFSMIDFAERPNALYFYAKRSFAPILICLTEKTDAESRQKFYPNAAIIINDRSEPLTGDAVFELLDMKGRTLDTSEFPVSIGPYSKSTAIVPRAFLKPVFPEKSVLRLAVIHDKHIFCENLYLYLPDKYAAFKPVEIDLTIRPAGKQKILLGLKSRYFVKDLEIVPAQDAHLSDNFFDLLPERNYEVAVDFTEPIARPDIPFVLRSVCTI